MNERTLTRDPGDPSKSDQIRPTDPWSGDPLPDLAQG